MDFERMKKVTVLFRGAGRKIMQKPGSSCVIIFLKNGNSRHCIFRLRAAGREEKTEPDMDSMQKMRCRNEEIMSFRDLGIIELSVFVALIAAFLLFFVLFVILRHRKRAVNNRKLLRKRALMEEAVQKKVRRAGEKPERMGLDGETAMRAEEYETFAPPRRGKVQRVVRGNAREVFGEEFAEDMDMPKEAAQPVSFTQEYSSGKENVRGEETLRMWDNNSKSVRTAKRSQQDPPFFVEERRISHRRDQLKRLEEAK